MTTAHPAISTYLMDNPHDDRGEPHYDPRSSAEPQVPPSTSAVVMRQRLAAAAAAAGPTAAAAGNSYATMPNRGRPNVYGSHGLATSAASTFRGAGDGSHVHNHKSSSRNQNLSSQSNDYQDQLRRQAYIQSLGEGHQERLFHTELLPFHLHF